MLTLSATARMAVHLGGVLLCLVLPALPGAAEQIRTVRGQVVAVNAAASPPVIVVTVPLGKGDALVVGATVENGTDISRGARKVTLEDVKVGETVVIGYVKHEGGLSARSIHAR